MVLSWGSAVPMTDTFTLDARLDTSAAERLTDVMTPWIGKSLTLDASAVEHLGARCLEVLLKLRHIAARSDATLSIAAPSDAFLADLATFGLTPHDISTGERT